MKYPVLSYVIIILLYSNKYPPLISSFRRCSDEVRVPAQQAHTTIFSSCMSCCLRDTYFHISGPIQLKLHATFLTNIIFFRWVTWTYHYRNIQFSAKCCLPLHYIITLYSMRYSHFKVGVAQKTCSMQLERIILVAKSSKIVL